MYDLPLLPGEVDKAVDVYLYAHIDVGVLIYLPGKDTEPVGRVGMAVRDGGVIGFEDEGEVGELIAKAVRTGGRSAPFLMKASRKTLLSFIYDIIR